MVRRGSGHSGKSCVVCFLLWCPLGMWATTQTQPEVFTPSSSVISHSAEQSALKGATEGGGQKLADGFPKKTSYILRHLDPSPFIAAQVDFFFSQNKTPFFSDAVSFGSTYCDPYQFLL